MAYLLGALTGGLILITALVLIISLFAFKRDVPKRRALKTVGTAVLIAIFISLFGAGFDPMYQGTYALCGIILFPIMGVYPLRIRESVVHSVLGP
jgi:multisubunit Na+/H+ antiporter MnhB subunit